MTRSKQIKQLDAEIKTLQAEIKELDWWFIANIAAREGWNERMNRYWNLRAKAEDKRDQRIRLKTGKNRLKRAPSTQSISRHINLIP